MTSINDIILIEVEHLELLIHALAQRGGKSGIVVVDGECVGASPNAGDLISPIAHRAHIGLAAIFRVLHERQDRHNAVRAVGMAQFLKRRCVSISRECGAGLNDDCAHDVGEVKRAIRLACVEVAAGAISNLSHLEQLFNGFIFSCKFTMLIASMGSLTMWPSVSM